MKLRIFLVRSVAAGIAANLTACSMSTPSPHSGLHHEMTPRVIHKGDMATRIEANFNPSFNSALQRSAGLAHGFGLKNGRQFDVLLELGSVEIPLYDAVGDTNALDEQDVFYFGFQLKNDLDLFRKPSRVFSASVFGLGMGEYGNFAEYIDAYGGASVGLDNPYISPYFALTGGLSIPYRRKFFHYLNRNLVRSEVTTVGKYHYVASSWLLTEYGLESPFGNRERGIRLYCSVGQGFYGMLEKDDVARNRDGIPVGFEFLYKMGLSWTY